MFMVAKPIEARLVGWAMPQPGAQCRRVAVLPSGWSDEERFGPAAPSGVSTSTTRSLSNGVATTAAIGAWKIVSDGQRFRFAVQSTSGSRWSAPTRWGSCGGARPGGRRLRARLFDTEIDLRDS